MQHRQCADTLTQVSPGGFSGVVAVAADVEHVVGELKRHADQFAVGRHHLDDVVIGAGHQGAEASRCGDQRTGLVRNDAEVVLHRVVPVARTHGLLDLPDHEATERLRLNANGIGPEVGEQLRGS